MPNLTTGLTWETDPDGNIHAAQGRTAQGRWVRAVENRQQRAVVKTSPDRVTREVYSLGMERVCWTLGNRHLGLLMPDVWLEDFQGEPAAVIARVRNTREWRQAGATPMLMSTILNEDQLAIGVAFDIWTANRDRTDRNMLVEPHPPDTRYAMASACKVWWIDQGLTALWTPSKFDENLKLNETEKVQVRSDGSMRPEVEEFSRNEMPDEYRQPFRADAKARGRALDAIRSVPDDEIEDAVAEIPSPYMSQIEAEKTIALLKARRDAIDTLSSGYC